MFILILIYVIVRYLTTLVPDQAKPIALIGLLLTLLYVALTPGGLAR